MSRRITLTVKNAEQTFRRLVDWLNKAEIGRKLDAVRREIQTESGLYLDKWVMPKNRWWLALSEAIELDKKGKRFKGRIKDIYWPFETASKMSRLYSGMPASRRQELRRRILRSNLIGPVLMEIDMAAHFWQEEFDLEWPESQGDGGRSSEFICRRGKITYEVECKAKSVDAGRMIPRPKFYRLADLLVARLRSRGLYGDVHIFTPEHFPKIAAWNALVADNVGSGSPGTSSVELNDESFITTSLMEGDGVVPKQEIDSRIASVGPFSHLALHVKSHSKTAYMAPILIHAESRTKDAFLNSVLRDLRKAKRQLSGKYTGVIVCFIPEVSSFNNAASNSALSRMCSLFFEKHAPDCVWGVTFISDRQIEVFEKNVETLYPSVTFYNPRYNQKWGPASKYMSSSF